MLPVNKQSIKKARRLAKQIYRDRKLTGSNMNNYDMDSAVDCACLIYGDAYPWSYVEKLYSMLCRSISRPIRFHVLTESSRYVPAHMIKHSVVEWANMGTRRSRPWWYKLQLFDPQEFSRQMLYLDLDVVITDSLDWIFALNDRYFWTVRDFKYLWRPDWQGINSSMMYWNPAKFDYVWLHWQSQNRALIMNQYHGDQDYISEILRSQDKRFVDEAFVKSWRWQINHGGLDMKRRVPINPHAGSVVPAETKIIVFHGTPKPHELQDPVIDLYWS